MTFSLVACDPERDEVGAAVASKFLAIGALVPGVEVGVGAIVSQAVMNPAYRSDGLALLTDGVDPSATLQRLADGDSNRDDRQAGIVDATGRAATRTGSRCMAWAGGRTGPGYAAQGNLLASGATVDALADTFEGSRGADLPLAVRLLDALAAGQAAGGDRRGQQAAAVLVARRGGGYGASDIAVDLRVDDHQHPIEELRRLYDLHERYFGRTAPERMLAVDSGLARELRAHLTAQGYSGGQLADDLMSWAAFENLEERVDGAARIDPVVLDALRASARLTRSTIGPEG